MAVYKSTRCYPFLNSLDVRVTQVPGSTEKPVQYLKCKVDTSNKKVTGYKIRILDEANNVIFEPDDISPISELQTEEFKDIYQTNGNNSGLNGTYLYIPFFQSFDNKKVLTYNAMYYVPKYSADYIVMDQALCNRYNSSITLTGANNINDTGWTKVSNELYYNNGEHPFVLDGETVLEGQIILFAIRSSNIHSISLGFYQVIKKIVGNTWYTALKKISDITYTDLVVNITRGKTFHNTNWQTSDGYTYDFYSSNLYRCYEGTTASYISGLKLEGALYKWEITLYQGDGTTAERSGLGYRDYSNLDNAEYDMITSSGTILGSNSSRIQIASDEPFTTSTPVLPGLNQGTLVLQGKYMGFGTSSTHGIFNEKRIYVQTYDASYGHVYPIEGDLDAGKVNYYNRVQFFKMTNDPDAIKETDTVKYGFGYNIEFYMYNTSGGTYTRVSLADFTNPDVVPINNRRYGIQLSSLPSSIRDSISEGDKILLTGQSSSTYTSPCQNGVYELYQISNSGLSDFFFLKRAASYDTWASYLGQVIFCPNFYSDISTTANVTNKESLAAAGSYELWDPDNVVSGSSDLYFTNEIPILIFGNKLNSNYTYDLVTVSSISDGDPVSGTIDGIMPQEGFLVISANSTTGIQVYQVQNSSGSLIYSKVNDTNLIPSTTDYYYISQGKYFGKKIIKGITMVANWDLYTAHILKNNNAYTFISPFINVKNNMKLKLLQDKTVRISGKQTSWIKINDVNNLLYCVKHPYISQPLASEYDTSTNSPWKYEVRTFFKTSDENPFYSYEMPYLILSKNNEIYSSLLRDDDQEYWVTETGDGEYPFKVKTDLTSDPSIYQNFVFNSFVDADTVYGRSVKFSADYIQFDGLSWESYRWYLYNKDGKLLQDTGKKYDKSIAVIFYGLSNDSTSESIYYAVLEVEDEKQNKITYIIKFQVQEAQKVNTDLDFRATVNCDIHAIKLDFSQYKFLKPSFRDNDIDNSILDTYGYMGGVSFDANTGATIYNQEDAPIDYTYGSNINSTDGNTINNLTYSGAYGLPYYTTFNRGEKSHEINNLSGLFIEEQQDDVDHNGQFYFETCVCLDPDFCGSIVSWSVENQFSDSDAYPYLTKDGEEFSKVGFLNFELRSADNFLFDSPTSSANYSVNPNRNRIILKISTDNEVNSQSHMCENIELFTIAGRDSFYYLQPTSRVNDSIKTSDYEFLEYDLSYYPGGNVDRDELYIKKDRTGNFFAGGEDYYLTNLCMNDNIWIGPEPGPVYPPSEHTFPYWDETRPFLRGAKYDARILGSEHLQFTRGAKNSNTWTNGTVQYWPTSGGMEEALFWDEPSDIMDNPILWEDVLATDPHVVSMSSLKRHYGIDDYNYHIICQIKDIKKLYTNLTHITIQETPSSGESDGTLSVLLLTDEEDYNYGTITIMKENN